MARRTKAEAEQTREAILDAAEILFAERGVGSSSLEDIARAAGVTRGAVYWHFADKPALFQALYQRVKSPMQQYLDDAVASDEPLQGLRDACVYVLKQLATDPHTQRVFGIMAFKCELAAADECRAKWQHDGRAAAIQKYEKALSRAKKFGQLANGISPKLAANALTAFIGGLINDFLRCPDSLNLKRDGSRMIDLFFSGLRA